MRKPLFTGVTLAALVSGHVLANEPLMLVLGRYINPSHASTMATEQTGAFKTRRLGVKVVPPSDPAPSPHMMAVRQADLAIAYQPQVHSFTDGGLPLVRVETLTNSPLNTMIALNKQIRTPTGLQGKKVGYPVNGTEQAALSTTTQHTGIDPTSTKLVNINFQPTNTLLAGQVDTIISGYRNIEVQEPGLQGKTSVVINIENYSISAYNELVITAHRDAVHGTKTREFLTVLQAGVSYLHARPQESWRASIVAHPELKTELNYQT